MELQGKVAIITGGAGNLGRACSRELAKQGAKVVGAVLPAMGIAGLVAEIEAAGGEVLGRETDVRSEAEIAALV